VKIDEPQKSGDFLDTVRELDLELSGHRENRKILVGGLKRQ
jgi:hypothetical protein